jgi:hypothetical protein
VLPADADSLCRLEHSLNAALVQALACLVPDAPSQDGLRCSQSRWQASCAGGAATKVGSS